MVDLYMHVIQWLSKALKGVRACDTIFIVSLQRNYNCNENYEITFKFTEHFINTISDPKILWSKIYHKHFQVWVLSVN